MFIDLIAYVKKSERAQIHDLTLKHNNLESQQQVRPKLSKQEEIPKLRA